jgi:hypothetical protein
MDVQKIELSRHLFLAERLTKRAMDAAKTPKAAGVLPVRLAVISLRVIAASSC